jgi:hypothetical protein
MTPCGPSPRATPPCTLNDTKSWEEKMIKYHLQHMSIFSRIRTRCWLGFTDVSEFDYLDVLMPWSRYVQGTLGKQVMGWEEVLFKTGAASGNSAVIVDSWARSSWQQAATLEHRTVASNSGNLYLDIHSSPASHQWADLRAGTTNKTLLSKLLGGEASMYV